MFYIITELYFSIMVTLYLHIVHNVEKIGFGNITYLESRVTERWLWYQVLCKVLCDLEF